MNVTITLELKFKLTQPTGSIRALQFPLNNSADIESVTPIDAIENIDLVNWSTTDSDERVDIVLNLSLNEYIALATSVDVGRDIAYGDNSIYIWWVWVRSLKSMSLCASILECVQTDEELQRAISGLSTGSNLLPTDGRKSYIENELVLQGNINCDNDNLFGAITGIVDLYNNLAEDLIETLVSSVNSIGRMGDVIEAIPVIGLLPYDDILQFVESFVDDLQQNYLASYTVATRDEYRCELFCLAQGNCGLTFTDIFNYYNDKMISQMFATDVQDVVDYLTTGSFAGSELVLAFHAFVASFFMFGSSFLGITDTKLIAMVSSMFNDPDPDWAGLCTTCAWTWNSDFPTTENIWTPSDNGYGSMAIWTTLLGYDHVDIQNGPTNYSRVLQIQTPVFTPTQVDSVDINFDLTKGTYGSGTQGAIAIVAIKNDDSQVRVDITNSTATNGIGKMQSLVVNQPDIKQIRFYIRSSSRETPMYDGIIDLNTVQVTGVGFNPFV